MNTTFDILLKKFGEIGIAQHIRMYSLPRLDDDLKRDISTFHFIWYAIQNVYIPMALEHNVLSRNVYTPMSLQQNVLSSIYRYLIQEIILIEQKQNIVLLNDKTWLLNKMKYMILKMKRSSRLILMNKLGLLTFK